MNSDRFGIRVDRLRPLACHSLNPDTAPASRCRVATVCTYGYKLSSRFHFHFPPTPYGPGRSNSSVPRNLRLFFRLLMPGRCAPSFSPKPLTSLTAASPTHRGERMHGVTPIGRKRIIRSGCVGSPLIPPRAARCITSMPEQPAAHGEEGTAYSQTARDLRESLSLHCVARHPSFAVCSGNAYISLSLLVSSTSPKTDTSPAHLDYTPTPDPDARCDDALTPLRQSANHFTHSEFAYGLGQGQVGTLL